MQTYKLDGLTRHQLVGLYQKCAAERLRARTAPRPLLLATCEQAMRQIQSTIRLMTQP